MQVKEHFNNYYMENYKFIKCLFLLLIFEVLKDFHLKPGRAG